jgi:hypothetical protein
MEKTKNNYISVRFSTIVCCILAILLCTAPCSGRTVACGETLNVGFGKDVWQIENDYLLVFGTVNLYPGACVDWAIYAVPGSTINIYGGELGDGGFIMLFAGEPDPVVTVYGTNFAVDKFQCDPSATEFTLVSGVFSVLTGTYGGGGSINLKFYGRTPVYLGTLDSEVEIDITPGGNPNTINLKSKGVVAVAVLTTDDFNAGTIEPSSVQFAGAPPVRWKLEDVDDDGDDDMLFHFRTQQLNLDQSSTHAVLTGVTTDEAPIHGSGEVRIVQPKK